MTPKKPRNGSSLGRRDGPPVRFTRFGGRCVKADELLLPHTRIRYALRHDPRLGLPPVLSIRGSRIRVDSCAASAAFLPGRVFSSRPFTRAGFPDRTIFDFHRSLTA